MGGVIGKISEADATEAIRVLAGAFADNPAYVWAFPNEAKRDEKFHWFMQKVLALSRINGLCLKTENNDAVALWFEPGNKIGWIELIRAGLYELPFNLGLSTYLRIQSILNQNAKFMKQIMGDARHYYLFHLAVAKGKQGQGLGSSLIKAVTREADLQQLPCFLETDKSRNIPLYEKHGFTIKASADLAPDVPLWYMRREPK